MTLATLLRDARRDCATLTRGHGSIDTTRLAAQVKRRQAVYVRSRSGRLKVVAYVPLEKKIEKGKWGKENEGHGISALSSLDSH